VTRRAAHGVALFALVLSASCASLISEDFKDYGGPACTASQSNCGGAAGGGGDAHAGVSGAVGDSGASAGDPGANERGGATIGGSGTSGGIGAGGSSAGAGAAGATGTAGAPPDGIPSCRGLMANCGPDANDDCCTADFVPGGTFGMGSDMADAADAPRHTVNVPDFELDRYEVTVGRFRNFVAAYDDWIPPAADSGSYAARVGSGWLSSWDTQLEPDAVALVTAIRCGIGGSISVDNIGTWWSIDHNAELLAISCIDWYTAFAFCIWDGGRLPTEAEWEYAAAGGDEERVYPWGDVFTDPQLVNYDNYHQVIAVGTAGSGSSRGRFGQYDLIGNVWEWVRDDFAPNFYSTPAATMNAPLNFSGGNPVQRGASFYFTAPTTTTAYSRETSVRGALNPTYGMRCARDVAVP
jgi:formylglycine-generating enzyme